MDLDALISNVLSRFHSIEITPYYDQLKYYLTEITYEDVRSIFASTGTTLALIIAAEIGDKSQLVCMALASKHRPVPVLGGALAAFALLNLLAVIFGAAVSRWLPEHILALIVAALFILFGIQALRTQADEPEEQIKERSGHGIFITTFLLIIFAEFGDKTQLAVVALGSTNQPFGVWLGATIALGITSALGIFAGRKLIKKFPLELLHKISGILFLGFAALAISKAFYNFPPI